jgi:lipoic acid synthetase
MKTQKPEWLKIKSSSNQNRVDVERMVADFGLHTVCEEADCPNLAECFNNKTATFMILGNVCTRNCTFCNVLKGMPEPVEADESVHVARAVRQLGLRHAVITSVTRDDLEDGGSGHFASVIEEIRKLDHAVTVEVLTPDFRGKRSALETVLAAGPDILNHNIETVPALYPEVRPMAVYRRSLEFLRDAKSIDSRIFTKSGMMLGLGEKKEEVIAAFRDLQENFCDFLTIGQYLPTSPLHHPLIEYIHPDVFEEYRRIAIEMGFKHVASGPLVRSSYHAARALEAARQETEK